MTDEQLEELESDPQALVYNKALYPAIVSSKIVDAYAPYGYEFLPNSSRLVITPLTERCF